MHQKCCVCNSTNKLTKIEDKIYCGKHYMQIKRYGKILKRTIFDKNEIILFTDYAKILLYNKSHEKFAEAIIDLEDVNICKNYKWSLKESNNIKYVVSYNMNNKKSLIRLHRLIMNAQKDQEVDHINHDTLNNRKSNLRLCSHQENMMNRKIPLNNTSGVIGVSWSELHKHWQSQIEYKDEHIHLGWYKNKNDAIKARKNAEKKYFKEFTPTINEKEIKYNEHQ